MESFAGLLAFRLRGAVAAVRLAHARAHSRNRLKAADIAASRLRINMVGTKASPRGRAWIPNLPLCDARSETERGIIVIPSPSLAQPKGKGRKGKGRVFTFDIHADSELDTHVILSKQSRQSVAIRFSVG